MSGAAKTEEFKMPDLKKAKETFFGPKGSSILIFAGVAGILLIFLSQFWSTSSSSDKKSSSVSSASTTSAYAASMEKSLCGIIGNIEGVGRVKVMVTLQSGVQYVYEQNEKATSNQTQTSGDNAQTQQSADTEESTVLAQDGSGDEEPVIKTEMQPAVQGVIVVCDGGGDPVVKEEVLETVMTALGLSATSISVNPMASAVKTASR